MNKCLELPWPSFSETLQSKSLFSRVGAAAPECEAVQGGHGLVVGPRRGRGTLGEAVPHVRRFLCLCESERQRQKANGKAEASPRKLRHSVPSTSFQEKTSAPGAPHFLGQRSLSKGGGQEGEAGRGALSWACPAPLALGLPRARPGPGELPTAWKWLATAPLSPGGYLWRRRQRREGQRLQTLSPTAVE